MTKIFCFIAILLLSVSAFSQEVCYSLFKGNAGDLAQHLGSQNAENDMQIFNLKVQEILTNYDQSRNARNHKVHQAAKAIKEAAFVEGLFAGLIRPERMKVHAGKIEKTAEALLKLNLLFDGDLLRNEIKENKNMIMAARRSLVVIGLRRYLEMQGVQIVEHWDFSSPRAILKSSWHDVLKPLAKLFLTMNPTRRNSLTEEQAQRILWLGLNSPTTLKWASQDDIINFKEKWNWWSEHYPRFAFKWTLYLGVAGILVGTGMVYKSYERSNTESMVEYAERKMSMDALIQMIRQDSSGSLLQDAIEIYRERHQGEDPPPEFIEITKAQILTKFPNAKFDDGK